MSWSRAMLLGRNGFGNDSFVKLLVQPGTSIVDTAAGAAPHTLTAHNSAAVVTDAAFPSGSAVSLGANGYVDTPSSEDWHLRDMDFTIDCFVRPSPTYADFGFLGTTGQFLIGRQTSNNWKVWLNSTGADGAWSLGIFDTGLVVSWGNVQHVALVRSGSSFLFFVDGATANILTSSASLKVDNSPLMSGNTYIPFTNSYFSGLRISKGVARWTRPFTVPSRAY